MPRDARDPHLVARTALAQRFARKCRSRSWGRGWGRECGGAGGAGPLLRVRELVKHFPVRGGGIIPRTVGQVQAVSGVSFDVDAGETLGLVGESGCGKSTVGRAVLQLRPATSGSVRFEGTRADHARAAPSCAACGGTCRSCSRIRSPRSTRAGRSTTSWPSRCTSTGSAGTCQQRVDELLETVGLNPEHRNRYPHEFSGGQRQRIGIARALALSPKLIVLDEPVSALDVSVQAGVLNLLEELQDSLDLAYVFIAHNLSVVRHISDRIAVMYLGKIVELGSRDDVYADARHPYTQALLSAAPVPDPVQERQRDPDRADRGRAQPGGPAVGLPVPDPVLEGAGAVRRARNRRCCPRTVPRGTSPPATSRSR